MGDGRGIRHEEFHSDEVHRVGGTLETVQLWVKLPQKHRNIARRYQDIRSGEIPRVALPVGWTITLQLLSGRRRENSDRAIDGSETVFSTIMPGKMELEVETEAELRQACAELRWGAF